MVISLRRSNVSGSPHIYVINTYAKIRSRNQTATLSLRTYNVTLLAGYIHTCIHAYMPQCGEATTGRTRYLQSGSVFVKADDKNSERNKHLVRKQ